MKIPSIRSVENRQNNNKNNAQKTNFTGGVDALVNFWQIIDNSRALQFTVEDMLGTNIPRTWKGAMAGYKYTGKINVPALLQEAIREFLTGPTMCVAPILILATGIKNSGQSADTHIENIKNLSHLARKSAKDGLITQENYYKTVAEDLLTQVLGDKTTSEDIELLYKGLLNLEASTTKGLTKKAIKKEKGAALEQLQNTYSEIIKNKANTYKGIDFLKAKYSINETRTGVTKFKNYAQYTTAYYQDLAKKHLKDGSINVEKIKGF